MRKATIEHLGEHPGQQLCCCVATAEVGLPAFRPILPAMLCRFFYWGRLNEHPVSILCGLQFDSIDRFVQLVGSLDRFYKASYCRMIPVIFWYPKSSRHKV